MIIILSYLQFFLRINRNMRIAVATKFAIDQDGKLTIVTRKSSTRGPSTVKKESLIDSVIEEIKKTRLDDSLVARITDGILDILFFCKERSTGNRKGY
jgi:hypothetical protein